MVTQFRLRLYLLALVILAGFGVLAARLYRVQIEEHEQHLRHLPGRRYETVRIPGVRGEIKDRNGITLAENVANFEVRFDLKEIIENYLKVHDTNKLPKREWTRYKRGQPMVEKETDIVEIVKDTVFPGLAKLGLLEDFNADQLRVHFRSNSGVVPYTYRRNLTFEEFARFAENNIGLPGVAVTVTGQRNYLYDSLACHVLGYVNLPDIEQVPEEKRREFNYYVGDDYGASGIEKTMDHYLQGDAGKRVLEKDEKGKFVGEASYTPPGAGADVFLTIDARIQIIAEEALHKIGRGAAVVMDPQTGEILALASKPSYNPNVFVPSVSVDDWNRYTQDRTSPMFNRAVNPNAPGSTYKIPIALAGCLSNSWKRHFACGGGNQYGAKFMKCWCADKGYTHGSPGLPDAIKQSCNGFFYRYANDTGIQNILTMSELLGLGRATGVKITGELPGNAPGPEWMRMQGLIWSDAYTAMTGIGQGFVEASPLQMTSVTATVANGGFVYQPEIIKKVMRSNNEVVWNEPAKLRHDLTKEGLTSDQIEAVKMGMWKAVNEPGGTAGRVASKVTVISGKTGTAQTGQLNQPTNAWFISFAPYEKPRLAVCVFVENGKSGGGAASPIAKNIIERTIAMWDHGQDVEVTKMAEAGGHFDLIEYVSFEGEEVVIASADGEGDAEVDVAAFVPQHVRSQRQVRPMQGYATPTIRRRADADGSVSSNNAARQRKFQPLKWLGVRGR